MVVSTRGRQWQIISTHLSPLKSSAIWCCSPSIIPYGQTDPQVVLESDSSSGSFLFTCNLGDWHHAAGAKDKKTEAASPGSLTPQVGEEAVLWQKTRTGATGASPERQNSPALERTPCYYHHCWFSVWPNRYSATCPFPHNSIPETI